MIERIEKDGARGFLRLYQDDEGFYLAEVQMDNQKQVRRMFEREEHAKSYLSWVKDNWAYHKKEVPIIRTTPKLVS